MKRLALLLSVALLLTLVVSAAGIDAARQPSGADWSPSTLTGRPDRRPAVWPTADNGTNPIAGQLELSGPALAPAEIPSLVMSASGGPQGFCPSWTLHYVVTLSNETSADLRHAVLTARWPAGACCPTDGPGNPVAGVPDPAAQAMTWHLGTLACGTRVQIRLNLHALSTLPTGGVVTTALELTADELPGRRTASVALSADRGSCPAAATPAATGEATQTPTPGDSGTPTATATWMPLRGWSALPLIVAH